MPVCVCGCVSLSLSSSTPWIIDKHESYINITTNDHSLLAVCRSCRGAKL